MMTFLKEAILKNKVFVIVLFTAIGLAVALGLPQLGSAQTASDAVCEGIGAVSGGNGCSTPRGEPTIQGTISTVINILSIVVGVIAVIMVIVGGLKFVTSQGDASATASARSTVIYALIGLVIASLAQILVRFVITRI